MSDNVTITVCYAESLVTALVYGYRKLFADPALAYTIYVAHILIIIQSRSHDGKDMFQGYLIVLRREEPFPDKGFLKNR